MYIGNIVLLILNLPLIPYISRLLAIPRPILIPMILLFSLTGVYLVSFNTFDIHMMVIICIIALFLRLLDFPMAPMLLGFILGGMLEDNLRRALVINDGSLSFMWERPLTASILGIALLTLAGPPLLAYLRKRLQLRRGEFAVDGE
jgi:putative tricarboxylic transport membrane protein